MNFSLEIGPHTDIDTLPAIKDVYITLLPGGDYVETAKKAGDLAKKGFNPVPHFPARSIADEAQGADILMVKPALAYLDIVREIKDKTSLPMAVYNVSGEYSMVKAAAQNGWVDYEAMMIEILTSFKRAGADMIISYHSKDFAKIKNKGLK